MAARDQRSLLKRFTTNTYVAGALPTIGGIMFGCDISSMSAQLSNPYYLRQFKNPDSDLQGGITAAMPAGSFGGALINSWLSDRIGRKKCIMLSGWIWVIGCAIQAAAPNVPALVAGRVIAGLGVGIASAIVTVYQAEITKPSVRGRIVSIQQLSITIGIFLQYFCQYGCSFIEGDASFRLPWALQIIPGLILGTLMMIFPESPRWLMDKGREDEALQILADVHGMGNKDDELVQIEYLEIKEQIALDQQSAKSYLDLLKPDVRRRVFLGMSEQMWSQLTGMMIVYVMQSAGLQGRRSELIASSVQYSLNVIFTFPGMWLIDRVGRRPLMFFGALAMATWLALVGGLQAGLGHEVTGAEAAATTTWKVDGHPSGRNAIIVFSYLFVCSFAVSWGPCSWTYASEIFPTKVRGKAVSFATATNWVFNFALAYATPPAFRDQQWRTYFIYFAFNIAAAIHIFFMFPETKGRTLEEMEEVFAHNAFTAWRVPPSVGKKTLADLEQCVI
ncbi:general substrate transporter [Rhodotorula diobovata]|uniref:General substrate transporter n=1 Tax=Rhodotorula diobovata TaxID=5288 RepID=A0A5C5G6T6_9BASI|nr:general substrate transporter [Rhodotorula diobovata]